MRVKVLKPFPCALDGIHVRDLAEGETVELTDAGTIEGLLAEGLVEEVSGEPSPEVDPAAEKPLTKAEKKAAREAAEAAAKSDDETPAA